MSVVPGRGNSARNTVRQPLNKGDDAIEAATTEKRYRRVIEMCFRSSMNLLVGLPDDQRENELGDRGTVALGALQERTVLRKSLKHSFNPHNRVGGSYVHVLFDQVLAE